MHCIQKVSFLPLLLSFPTFVLHTFLTPTSLPLISTLCLPASFPHPSLLPFLLPHSYLLDSSTLHSGSIISLHCSPAFPFPPPLHFPSFLSMIPTYSISHPSFPPSSLPLYSTHSFLPFNSPPTFCPLIPPLISPPFIVAHSLSNDLPLIPNPPFWTLHSSPSFPFIPTP